VKRIDAKLIDTIRRATQGGCILLRTLGVRGKALERADPERAEFLLGAVRSHPLYKGGRLAFDMLELEDLMLDPPSGGLLNDVELAQLLRAVATNAQSLFEPMRGFGLNGGDGAQPPTFTEQSSNHPDIADAQTPGTFLPRVSFGPTSDPLEQSGSSGSNNGRNAPETEPDLLASDYLYDYVVLGFLDMLARHITD
jgi:hypothetical protein